MFQHAACNILIRCDCKGVVQLVNKILNDEGYDSKHEDADILEAIQQIHNEVMGNRLIKWIPAHLDEPKTIRN